MLPYAVTHSGRSFYGVMRPMGNHHANDDMPCLACKPHSVGAGGEAFDLATELLAHTFAGIFKPSGMGLLYMPDH